MTDIINGKVIRNEVSAKSMGGTELMAEAMAKHIDPDLLQKFQIVNSRVRKFEPGKKYIYVAHDLPNDPEAQHIGDKGMIGRWSGIVFPSNWSMQIYNLMHQVPYGRCEVLRNAIQPITRTLKPEDGTVRLIYHTTPHRGLEILVPVFETLYEKYPNITLDVYSSFSIYGWDDRDQPYEGIFERCRQHPAINYHGAVPNDEVRAALQKAHIFAYPCIWPETSCIAAIEAMSACVHVVCPNYAALTETCMYNSTMYQWHENKASHAKRFLVALENVIEEYDPTHKIYYSMKPIIDEYYSWEHRAKQWNAYLESLL